MHKTNTTDIKIIIEGDTIIVGVLNTALTSLARCSGHNISKAAENLSHTTELMNLIDIYRTLHTKTRRISF